MSSANSTADRAIEILLMFDDLRPVITAAEVAERFKMPRSTTYRYLTSLRAQGLLVEAGDAGFRLGHRILALARIARQGFTILQISRPHLQRALKATGETVLLTQRTGEDLTVLECLESSSPIRISYERGQVLPTPASASAKIFLAFDTQDRTNKLLKKRRFTQYTDHTITEPVALAKNLQEVRANGYAVNHNEVDDGITAVAAPVYDAGGGVEYSVSIVVPSFRVDDKRLKVLADEVKKTAAAISEANAASS
jgi:DNA-binding IclR family transcriptional regulator